MFNNRGHARDEEGFTLIELLIVIVILGVLAAIVVFAVGNTGKDSAKSACKSDAKSIEVAQEAYKAANNSTYAASTTALIPNYLKEAINGGAHYSITTDTTGAVLVKAPASAATAVDFVATPTACDGAT